MSDVLERLRRAADVRRKTYGSDRWAELLADAVAEIERLRRERKPEPVTR